MRIFRSALSLLLAAMCGLAASCADVPSQPRGPQVQRAPAATGQDANGDPGAPRPRLTIQAGEGEQLNLPWFIRDAQHWINQ